MLRTSLRLAWRGLSHATRIMLEGALLFVLLFSSAVLALRYWILPDIEQYHNAIVTSVSQAIGQPVSVGKIEADWSGIHPHLLLSDVRILDKNIPGVSALALQRVETAVSWSSLLHGELRLYSLVVDRPDLLVRRDAQGMLHVAGVALSSDSTSQNGVADWLLHQRYLMVQDARITWQDDLRGAPPLAFEHLNLLVENRGQHHRFALLADPPAALSSQLDVRGDFSGRNFEDLSAWHGQVYTRLDYADVNAWRPWVQLPAGFRRGHGALRGWLEVADGRVSRVTTDLALANVETQLADDLQPLNMRMLRGRIGWQSSAQGVEISTRGISLQMADGLMLQPTDFYLRLDSGQPGGGEIRANMLELADLASLTAMLPLDRDLKRRLAEFSPRGRISDLRAKWQNGNGRLAHYEINAKFEQLSVQKTDKFPGFSGVSGEVDGSDRSGTLALKGRAMTIDAPQIMPEPLEISALAGTGNWQTNAQGQLEVRFNDVAVDNADLNGTVYGSYQVAQSGPGRIDLNISLAHVALNHAERYIPLTALGRDTRNWLHNALQGGQAEDFHLRLSGDLNDFPFANGNKGAFQIQARIKDGVLQYAKDWPRIENIAAELRVEGQRLELTSTGATLMGLRLMKNSVAIPDMFGPDEMLQVRGDASGETARGLDFIQQSPVRGYIDGFTDGMTARGNGTLHLSADIPLSGSKLPVVSGSYHFTDNDINLGSGAPTLYKTNGDLLFTESSVAVRNATAQVLGGPATLSAQGSTGGVIAASAHGKFDADILRKKEPHPFLDYLHGGSAWEGSIQVRKGQRSIVVTSDMAGLASSLPAPFDKTADAAMPLRLEIKSTEENQDVILLQYGKLLSARLYRSEEGGSMAIKRGTLNFGGTGRWRSRDGVWLTGMLPNLSLEGWGGLMHGSAEGPSRAGGAPFTIAGVDLSIHRVEAFGYGVDDLRIRGRGQGGTLNAQLAAHDLNGEMSWQGQGMGRLVARLKNLSLGKSGGGKEGARKAEAPPPVQSGVSAVTEFPELDMVVEDASWRGKQLGRVELLAKQHGREWNIERVRIVNPDGSLLAEGKYYPADGAARTQVHMSLEITDAGKMLARFGYPDSMSRGSGKLEGNLSWRGAPDDFNSAALNGTIKLDTGKGQFLKLDPGGGKLLSILSLQALPRHITLDFTDVFSNGFVFDSISGTAEVKQGVLSSNDFKIEGSSAKVTMMGQVDLEHETQNLRVRILPTVGNSVSLLGALVGGPAVGIGAFIANKILREPLDKLASFEYNVTGTWASPNVVKVGQQKFDKPAEVKP